MTENEKIGYQQKEASGGGDVLGNKLNFNYKGSNKCPDGFTWVRGYWQRNGVLRRKTYISGHCRKVTDGGEEERRKGWL